MKKKIIIIAAIASLFFLVANIALNLLVLVLGRFGTTTGEAAAIAIIGGADGPTSIYVTDRSIVKTVMELLVQAAVTLALFVCWFRLRKKEK